MGSKIFILKLSHSLRYSNELLILFYTPQTSADSTSQRFNVIPWIQPKAVYVLTVKAARIAFADYTLVKINAIFSITSLSYLISCPGMGLDRTSMQTSVLPWKQYKPGFFWLEWISLDFDYSFGLDIHLVIYTSSWLSINFVSSTCTTASASCGKGAPVVMRITFPAVTDETG